MRVCRTFLDDWRGVPEAVEQFVPTDVSKTLLIRDRQSSDLSYEEEISNRVKRQAVELQLTADGVVELLDGVVQRLVGKNLAGWALKASSLRTFRRPMRPPLRCSKRRLRSWPLRSNPTSRNWPTRSAPRSTKDCSSCWNRIAAE